MSVSIQKYLLTVAAAVATRSTCRRQVGCVLADSRGKILSTGYNGPPSGVSHCDERGCSQKTGCKGAAKPGCTCSMIPGCCDAIHAEVNALIQVQNADEVHYAAVTRAPCLECTKLLLNSGVQHVIYLEQSSYPDAQMYFMKARLRKGSEKSYSFTQETP